MSLVTIGYGDYHISTDPGRAIFIIWALLSIPLITIAVSYLGDSVISSLQENTKRHLMKGKDQNCPERRKQRQLAHHVRITTEDDIQMALGNGGENSEGEDLEEQVTAEIAHADTGGEEDFNESEMSKKELLGLAHKEITRAARVASKISKIAGKAPAPKQTFSFDEYLELSKLTGKPHDPAKTRGQENIYFVKEYAEGMMRLSRKLEIVVSSQPANPPTERSR